MSSPSEPDPDRRNRCSEHASGASTPKAAGGRGREASLGGLRPPNKERARRRRRGERSRSEPRGAKAWLRPPNKERARRRRRGERSRSEPRGAKAWLRPPNKDKPSDA